MEKYTMFMEWKNQYSENEYTTQSTQQGYMGAAGDPRPLRGSFPQLPGGS